MLSVLHIENIAVIEQANISFDRGFNVLTGETGAGKSIVIDAISAILGERTYRDVIRTGAGRAFVSAVFTGTPRLVWFEENQIPYDPDELLVQREVYQRPSRYGLYPEKARGTAHPDPWTARLAAAFRRGDAFAISRPFLARRESAWTV